MTTGIEGRTETRDHISWYYERRGSGPDVVLIPSGEGDCTSFAKVADALASSFSVTTFDMPGFSRTKAPESAMSDISAAKLAVQILNLMDKLSIDKATFWGCSSGGLVALILAANHPDRVRNVIVHEVPLGIPSAMPPLKTLDDAAIVQQCRHLFGTVMCEDESKWNSLGPAYRERWEKNVVTWVRTYMASVERSFTKEELTSRPVTWTIGALTPAGMFFQNVVDGYGAGIQVGLLPSKHFPQLTAVDVLEGHIREAVMKYL